MTTKKDSVLAAVSEHRYRTSAQVAARADVKLNVATSALSVLYKQGAIDRRQRSGRYEYILRSRDVPLSESVTPSELRVLRKLNEKTRLIAPATVEGVGNVSRSLSSLVTKRGAIRVRRSVYRITDEGRAFIESLDKPKQQPLPAPTPKPTPTPTPEPEREPVPWPMPAHPPTVVERPQYTSAALIVAAAAIIIAIIVTGCIQ